MKKYFVIVPMVALCCILFFHSNSISQDLTFSSQLKERIRILQSLQSNPNQTQNPQVISDLKQDRIKTQGEQRGVHQQIVLKSTEFQSLKSISDMIVQRQSIQTIVNLWEDFIQKKAQADLSMDVDTLIAFVLRESYLETTEVLISYVERTKYFNDVKQSVRGRLQTLRQTRADWNMTKSTANLSIDKMILPEYPLAKLIRDPAPDSKITTVDDLDRNIKEWEAQLATIGDDTQTANVNLQNVIQKQMQIIEKMSNLMKVLRDKAMAIIRNLR